MTVANSSTHYRGYRWWTLPYQGLLCDNRILLVLTVSSKLQCLLLRFTFAVGLCNPSTVWIKWNIPVCAFGRNRMWVRAINLSGWKWTKTLEMVTWQSFKTLIRHLDNSCKLKYCGHAVCLWHEGLQHKWYSAFKLKVTAGVTDSGPFSLKREQVQSKPIRAFRHAFPK